MPKSPQFMMRAITPDIVVVLLPFARIGKLIVNGKIADKVEVKPYYEGQFDELYNHYNKKFLNK